MPCSATSATEIVVVSGSLRADAVCTKIARAAQAFARAATLATGLGALPLGNEDLDTDPALLVTGYSLTGVEAHLEQILRAAGSRSLVSTSPMGALFGAFAGLCASSRNQVWLRPSTALSIGEPKRMTLPSGSTRAPSCLPHSVSSGICTSTPAARHVAAS